MFIGSRAAWVEPVIDLAQPCAVSAPGMPAADVGLPRETSSAAVRPVGATRRVGVTVVLTAGCRGYLVTCTCGALNGRHRPLSGSAVAEAYVHIATGNCIPAQPLIDPHKAMVR